MPSETEDPGLPLCPRCCSPYGDNDEICDNCGFTVRTSPYNEFPYTLGVAQPSQPSLDAPPPPFKAIARAWSWVITLAITAMAMLITALNSATGEWTPMFISGAIAFPVSLTIGVTIRRLVAR